VDGSGNVYVADTGNAKIREITPGGMVSTLASGFMSPFGIAVDGSGNLYVVDTGTNAIDKITSGGSVSTLADATVNSLSLLDGIAVDQGGNVYVADGDNGIIRKITPGGVVTTLAGTAGVFGTADATGAAAQFRKPLGIAVDGSGNVYVADALADTIRKITPAGVVTTLGGVPNTSGSANGTGAAALFNNPFGLAIDGNGNLYIAEHGNDTIRMGTPPAAAPVFTLNPASSVTIASGRTAVFSVAATGLPAPTYQWYFNNGSTNVAITGATDPILELQATTAANAGTYTCAASNSVSTVTSSPGTLAVISTSTPGYLVSLSARANVGTGNNILIGGFTVRGSGTKQLIVRGVGPALAGAFGAGVQVISNPVLTLEDISGLAIATNTGWGNAPVARPSSVSVGPQVATSSVQLNNIGSTLGNGAADSAMLVAAPAGQSGDYTAEVSGVAGGTGIGLVEIYDADSSAPTGLIESLSARANVGTGNNILIGGFGVRGTGSETVMIRAIGPALSSVFGSSAILAQPVLTIVDGLGNVLYTNTGWGGNATIASVIANTVGPPGLDPASQDSVLLVTLPNGNYTAQVSGLNSGTGLALVEIYEVQ